ncbi:MFS transporter [Sphingomonas sp. AR_OL41]|uniref:MFS transporter n=1 Tax=Sphingomonas sp. AR_OL41 TaxID=3042729 RepID=UPI0024810C7C|nr:MFS transporter [Sphingomonas sp. AR_OL41]MDH7972858.1 MFS transporter [Sphingomonas sp. AR_OL41]
MSRIKTMRPRADVTTPGAESRRDAARMVAGAMLGNMVGANTVLTFTFGIFISSFHASYGWARADIALAMTCFTVVAFLGSSLIGRAADAYDPRRLAVASLVAFGVGLMSVPLFVRNVQSLWVAYFCLAILGLGTSPVVLNRPLIMAYSRRRGLAIALALTGSGLGGFVLPQLTSAFVDRGGWRYGFTALGCLAVIAAPLIWMLLGRRVPPPLPTAVSPLTADARLRFRDICRSRVFWTLSIIALFGGLGMSGPAAHLIPLLGDEGIGPRDAARLASIIGIASVIGRLLTGVVLDRFETPLSGAPLLALGAIGVGLLSRLDISGAAVAIALLGFVIGAEIAILAYYSSRYFGLRAHATIFGWMYGAVAFGSAIGPVLVGALRDRQGDYGLGFALSALALAISSLLCLFLGPYRDAVDAETQRRGSSDA